MNCDRSHGEWMELARGSVEGRRKAELRAHLRECARCQKIFEAQVRLSEAEASLTADAAPALPIAGMEAALLAEFDRTWQPRVAERVRRRWYVGAGIAAAMVLGWVLWPAGQGRTKQPVVKSAGHETQAVRATLPVLPLLPAEGPHTVAALPAKRAVRRPRHGALTGEAPENEQPFVSIPYTAPLSPDERADVIRMDLPVSALIAAGFPLHVSDPGARARADLVVSEDGRARAVRLISISNSDLNRSFR
jgi:hypothetical protein